jgi:hypothetical protein
MEEIAGIGLLLDMSELKEMFSKSGFTLMLDGFMENSVDSVRAAGMAMQVYHRGNLQVSDEEYDLEMFGKCIERQLDVIDLLVEVVKPTTDDEIKSQMRARASLALMRENVRKDIRGEAR